MLGLLRQECLDNGLTNSVLTRGLLRGLHYSNSVRADTEGYNQQHGSCGSDPPMNCGLLFVPHIIQYIYISGTRLCCCWPQYCIRPLGIICKYLNGIQHDDRQTTRSCTEIVASGSRGVLLAVEQDRMCPNDYLMSERCPI